MEVRAKAFKIIRGVFQRHGAVEIDTPVFEPSLEIGRGREFRICKRIGARVSFAFASSASLDCWFSNALCFREASLAPSILEDSPFLFSEHGKGREEKAVAQSSLHNIIG
jgi:hypothetical protein